MKRIEVPRATIGRIPLYLKYLKNAKQNSENISATVIAKELGLGEVQVRKDLGAVSGAGRPRTGYNIKKLVSALESFLGSEKTSNVVIAGAGKLGRALLDYDGFRDYGLKMAAAFDTSVTEAELSNAGNPIYPMSDFDIFCEDHNIKIGVIAVPAKNAQEVCDLFVKNGIKAIWCFAPCTLYVDPSIPVQYENMALSLAYLNKKI